MKTANQANNPQQTTLTQQPTPAAPSTDTIAGLDINNIMTLISQPAILEMLIEKGIDVNFSSKIGNLNVNLSVWSDHTEKEKDQNKKEKPDDKIVPRFPARYGALAGIIKS